MKAKIALLLLLTFAFACPPNCEDCDPAGITCSACSEGYEIDATSQCIMASIVPNCILYSLIVSQHYLFMVQFATKSTLDV